MKNRILFPLVTSLAFAASCISCSSSGGSTEQRDTDDPNNDIAISFVQTDNGKKLVVNNQFESSTGAFGVMIGYDEIKDVSSILSTNYSTVTETGGKYVCEASITTDNGSKISTVDTIYTEDGRVKIDRTFQVDSYQEGTADLGFATYFQIENIETAKPSEYEWFCPGNYYGNDEWTFSGEGVKTAFDSDHSVVANDGSGAPVMMCYKDGKGTALFDMSDGYRETTANDYGVQDSHIIYSEEFNMGGLGIREMKKNYQFHTQLYQTYPTYSYNFCGAVMLSTQYRMLPIWTKTVRTQHFEIECDSYHSFYSASKSNYRVSFDHYAVSDRRYKASDVQDALLEAIDKSFGYINSIPQYMCNSDHANPDSGFLYRNGDLGYLMLSAGRKRNNQSYIDHALTVIEHQFTHDRFYSTFVTDDEFYINRSRVDALVSFARNYQAELKKGYEHVDWYNYLIQKANLSLDSNYWPDSLFLTEMYRITETKSYLDKAKSLMASVEPKHLKNLYYGVLSNPAGTKIVEKEAGIFALQINCDLYELTKDVHYLNMAEKAALYTESFETIQPIYLDSKNNPGYGTDSMTGTNYNQGCMGNERFLAYGLSYVNAQVFSGDNCLSFVAPEFYRLWKITGDEHYYKMYDFLTYNTTLYINMGDKVGLMDDVKYSSGLGFQNEYFGIGTTSDVASFRRGSIHDSNLAWNMYGNLQVYERMEDLLGEGKITAIDDDHRDFDLKKNKYTYATENGYVTELGEVCDVKSIENYTGDFEYSFDAETWSTAAAGTAVKAAYIRLPLTVTDIDSVEIQGLPITYQAVNYGATVKTNIASMHQAMDWNYSSICTLTGGQTATIDLTKEYLVTEIALKNRSITNVSFSVRVSQDGVTYQDYMSYSNSYNYLHFYEKNVMNVRYIQLTIPSGGATLNIQEFKVLGIEC